MDMSLVLSAVTAQSANLQNNIAMRVMTMNNQAQKDAVQVLLGAGSGASQANVASGVGGNLDVSA